MEAKLIERFKVDSSELKTLSVSFESVDKKEVGEKMMFVPNFSMDRSWYRRSTFL